MREPVRELTPVGEPVPIEPKPYSVKDDIQARIDRRVKQAEREADRRVEQAERRIERDEQRILNKRLPGILARACDETIATPKLTPIERACREWRLSMIEQLGGNAAISTAQRTLILSACATWVVLSSLDAHVLDLATTDGLVNLETQSVRPVVLERQVIANGLAKQLQLLGLRRTTIPDENDLATILARENHNRRRA